MAPMRSKASLEVGRRSAIEAWLGVAQALAASVNPAGRELAKDVVRYVGTEARSSAHLSRNMTWRVDGWTLSRRDRGYKPETVQVRI